MNSAVMIYLRYFFSLALPTLCGYLFLSAISRCSGCSRTSITSSPAISFGLGAGILSQIMLILSILRIPFSFHAISSALLLTLALAFLSLVLTHSNPKPFSGNNAYDANKTKPYLTEKILYLLAIVFSAYLLFQVFWKASNIPVYTYDAIHFIAFKAKMFFFERNIDLLRNIQHPSYPLFTEFFQTWIALSVNGWTESFIKSIFPITFSAFLLIYWDFLRSYSTRTIAVTGVLFLLSSNFTLLHASISYRDMIILFFTSSSSLLLIRWYSTRNVSYLIIASFFGGFASFTKLEGTIYFLLCAGLLTIMLLNKKTLSNKIKISYLIKFLVPGGIVCLLFYIVKSSMGIPPEKVFLDINLLNIHRIPLILKAFSDDLLFSGNWNICWFLFFVSVTCRAKNIAKRPEVQYLLWYLGMFLVFYLLNGTFTKNFEWIGGPGTFTTISRLILHVFPIATAATVLLLSSGKDEQDV